MLEAILSDVSTVVSAPHAVPLWLDPPGFPAPDSGDAPRMADGRAPPGGFTAERYELGAELGVGGMARVYAARDRATGEAVALKLAADAPFARRQLVREATILRHLAHRNILSVLDSGVMGDGRPFFTMPVIDGVTVRDWVHEQGKLTTDGAAEIMLELCRALAPVHDRGLVHHDVTPANVMIRRHASSGVRLYLLDFGITRAADAAPSPSTVIAGTPGYMAPEVAAGASSDRRADVYAIGAVGAFLLCGGEPGGTVTSVEMPSSAWAVEEMRRGALERIIRRCMSELPAGRFPSVRELEASILAAAPDEDGRLH